MAVMGTGGSMTAEYDRLFSAPQARGPGIAPPPVEDTVYGDPRPARSILKRGYARAAGGEVIDLEGGAFEDGPAPSASAPVNDLPAAPREFSKRSAAQEFAQRASWGAPLPWVWPQGSQQKLEGIPAHGEAPENGQILYNFDGRDGRQMEPIAGMAGKTGKRGKKARMA